MRNLAEGNVLHSAYLEHSQHVENLLFSFVRFFVGFIFFSWASCGVILSSDTSGSATVKKWMLCCFLGLAALIAFMARYVVGSMQSYNSDYLARRFFLERAIAQDLEVRNFGEVIQRAQGERPKVVESIRLLFFLVGCVSLAAAVVVPWWVAGG